MNAPKPDADDVPAAPESAGRGPEAGDPAAGEALEAEVEQALARIQPPATLKLSVMAELRARAVSSPSPPSEPGRAEDPIRPGAERSALSKVAPRPSSPRPSSRRAPAVSPRRGRALRGLVLLVLLPALLITIALVLWPEEPPEPRLRRGLPVRRETPPRFELDVPARMAVGDRLVLTMILRNPGESRLDFQVRPRGEDGLSVEGVESGLRGADSGGLTVGRSVAPGNLGRVRIEVLGRAAGTGRLCVDLSWRVSGSDASAAARTQSLTRAIPVRPPGRPIVVAARAILDGPSARARLELPDKALDLASIEELRWQVIPGTLAELLAARECFGEPIAASMESNLAALWPMVLLGERGDDSLTRRSLDWLLEHQKDHGGFTLWPNDRATPRLTILGLRLLKRLGDTLALPEDRLERTRRFLLGLRDTGGAWVAHDTDLRARGDGDERSKGDFELTSLAVVALAETGTDPAELEGSLDWLEERFKPDQASLTERLALASAWLAVPGGRGRAEHLVDGLTELAEATADDELVWWAPKDAGGRRSREVTILRTAKACEVLGRLGREDEADKALRWLLRHRPVARDAGRAAFAAFQAVLSRELANPRLASGTLDLRVGRYSLAHLAVEAETGASRALVPTGLSPREAIAEVIARGLDVEFTGTGRVEVRLLVKGVEAWPDEALPAARRARQSRLTVDFDALPGLRVDETIAWRINVRNLGELRIETPVVEVDLPAGFVLAGADQLEEMVRSKALRGYERRGDRLRLVLQPLNGGQRRTLQLLVYARWPGQVSGGSVMVWRLDRPGHRVRRSGQAFRIRGELEAAPEPTGARGDPAVKDQPAEPVSAVASAGGPTDEGPELPLGAARRPFGADRVVRWEPDAGPILPDWSRLPLDSSNASRFLTLALHRGLPEVATVRRVPGKARSWDFQLKETRWSDGRAMTVDDFTRSWERARREWTPEESSALEQSRSAVLKAITWQRLGPTLLRVSWPEGGRDLPALLGEVPFLPTAEWSGDSAATYVSNGLWRIVRGGSDHLILGRGADGAGERVVVATPDFLASEAGGAGEAPVDLVARGAGRATRSRAAEISLLVPADEVSSESLYANKKASFAAFLRPVLKSFASARGWIIPVGGESGDVQPIARYRQRYRLAFDDDLEAPGKALAEALERAGVPVFLTDGASDVVRLTLARRPAGAGGSRAVVLAVIPGLLDSGLVHPARDAVSASGFVRWPLRIEDPDASEEDSRR